MASHPGRSATGRHACRSSGRTRQPRASGKPGLHEHGPRSPDRRRRSQACPPATRCASCRPSCSHQDPVPLAVTTGAEPVDLQRLAVVLVMGVRTPTSAVLAPLRPYEDARGLSGESLLVVVVTEATSAIPCAHNFDVLAPIGPCALAGLLGVAGAA